MSIIGYALKMANNYYTKEGFEHAVRVMEYVEENKLIPDTDRNEYMALALMHDLLEDTEYQGGSIDYDLEFFQCLDLLTRKQNETYTDYIIKIKNNAHIHPMAYWVKIADMKDHLSQKKTLTDSLKERYLNALVYLL